MVVVVVVVVAVVVVAEPFTVTVISAFTAGFCLLRTVTVQVPAETAVTFPHPSTVATLLSELVHISSTLVAVDGSIVTYEISF